MTELTLQTSLTHQQREYLEMVHSSAQTLLTVINDILDFSKIEAGKLDLINAPFSLWELLGKTTRSLALRAERKSVEFFCHISPETPEFVIGDEGRLRQVLVNLIGNALKFTHRGEILVSVGVERLVESEVELKFSIKDTGIGIPPAKIKTVFKAFEQADGSTSREYGGTGLGLAISTRLIHQMEGRIWVESEVGSGSTFYFVIKLETVDRTLAPSRVMPAELQDVRALIVDDNQTSLRIVCEILTKWHMRGVTANGGIEAIQLLHQALSEQDPFELVVLDAMMPLMDGFEVAQLIASSPDLKGTTIMMLSSGLPSDELKRCNELQISTVLSKPVTQSELFDAISGALAGGSPASEALPEDRVSTPPPARRLAILLAEDNAVNQIVARGILENRGHEVRVARDGLEAVQVTAAGSFDVVLMDVQMPNLDGYRATAQIRQRERKSGSSRTRIIAMTAHAMQGDREKCLIAGSLAWTG